MDYNAYWDALAGTAEPLEEATESAVENSDQLGMFISVFFFLIIIIVIFALFAFHVWRKQ